MFLPLVLSVVYCDRLTETSFTALMHCRPYVVLTASVVYLIYMSLWIKASGK